jgi:effector-binding domain-containing protein
VPKRSAVWNNSIVQKLLLAIGGTLLLLVIIGLALPQHARVVASHEIDAHPATVFSLVNDFHRVTLWSPWIETDPNARIIISGPQRGVGASMSWDGLILGNGSQTITESRPFEYIGTLINAGEAGAARSWFDFTNTGSATVVNWTFEADYGYNLVGRYVALLLRGIIKKDYEHGLGKLGELAESLPRTDFSDLELERLMVESRDIAYRTASSSPDPASMSAAMGKAYFQILSFIDANALQDAGAPISISRSFNGSEMLFDAAIPVRGISDSTVQDAAGVKIGKTYAGAVIRVRHQGAYRNLIQTHRKVTAYLAALGIERNGDAWESYVSDPTRVPESELLTDVYYPIR